MDGMMALCYLSVRSVMTHVLFLNRNNGASPDDAQAFLRKSCC